MTFTLSDWMIYTMWAIFGLMIINLLITLFQSFWKGSFDPTFVLNYLKDVLYYVLPLQIVVSVIPIDPTGWILVIFYFIGGIAVILKYLLDIKRKFQQINLSPSLMEGLFIDCAIFTRGNEVASLSRCLVLEMDKFVFLVPDTISRHS
ncbi:hypothetical protein [Aneurinibacillus tyrosinisolvens]|uniref:hypothetical protein n=1 Tax=Aneurinibacillus tyrosinisolvens TaxID=1443435 RepID=UPI00069B93D4|nr:hypothetical protein [Aneurinibacillus tyrosinisolvens]